MKDPRDILIKPLITEKSTVLIQDNKYTFRVDTGQQNANKTSSGKHIQGKGRKGKHHKCKRQKEKGS